MENNGQALLTFTELAQLLRVSRSTAGRMQREKLLPPSIIVGRRKRWRRLDVDKWLEQQQEGS